MERRIAGSCCFYSNTRTNNVDVELCVQEYYEAKLEITKELEASQLEAAKLQISLEREKYEKALEEEREKFKNDRQEKTRKEGGGEPK